MYAPFAVTRGNIAAKAALRLYSAALSASWLERLVAPLDKAISRQEAKVYRIVSPADKEAE